MTTSSHAEQAQVTDRDVFISRLRAMADWLEANPGLPLSPFCPVKISVFGQDLDAARDAMASAPGGWRKETSAASDYVTYEYGDINPADPGRWNVTYGIHVPKGEATACERVQVGTKFIPEHEEPVFEWKCAPDYEAVQQAEICGATPYPPGSEGDDGTFCALAAGHAGAHDEILAADA